MGQFDYHVSILFFLLEMGPVVSLLHRFYYKLRLNQIDSHFLHNLGTKIEHTNLSIKEIKGNKNSGLPEFLS